MDIEKGHCWRCERALPEAAEVGFPCTNCSLAEYCSARCKKQDAVRHGSVECEVFGPKRCNKCGKRDARLKECAGCNNSWYCDASCQRSHWPIHKKECQQVGNYIKKVACKMKHLYTINGEEVIHVYEPPVYIGNTFAVNFLQLQSNELADAGAEDFQRDFHVLSAGCGDLRSTVLTVASLPSEYEGKLHITLDDFDPFVMARNVLFLVMMVKFSTRDNIASSLVTIWYSVHISSSDYQLIEETLRELVKINHGELHSVTHGLVTVSEEDLCYLLEVWDGWLSLECRHDRRRSINLCKQRQQHFAQDIDAHYGMPQYLNRLPPKDRKYMEKWFKHGHFLPEDSHVPPFDNPTLTGRIRSSSVTRPKEHNFVYCIRTDQTPYMVWDCLRVDEFVGPERSSVMVKYHKYVTHLLQQVVSFITRERLTVKIFLANCLDFPNYHLTLKMPSYDRIFTSNLLDYIGPCKLIKTFQPLMNKANKHSTLVTQTMNWIGSYTPVADVQNKPPEDVFKCIAQCRKDTGFDLMVAKDVNNHREYYNNTHWFLAYLRAAIMAGGAGIPMMDHVPKLDEVIHYGGLQMRNFRKGRNKLVPFTYRVNAREVTMLNGHERVVEWFLQANVNQRFGSIE